MWKRYDVLTQYNSPTPETGVFAQPFQPQFTAVLLPPNHAQIESRQDYLELLCLRLEWAIDRWSKIQEQPLAEAYREICRSLTGNKRMYQDMPELTDPTWWWSRAVVMDNPDLDVKLGIHGVDFPHPVESDPEEREFLMSTIHSVTLEEWMAELGAELSLV